MAEGTPSTSLGRIGQHFSWAFSGRIIGALLSLLYLAIVTRSLRVDQYGLFSIILATTLIVQLILSFNIWQTIFKFGHEHVQKENFTALGRLIRLCCWVEVATALAGIFFTAVIFAGATGFRLIDQPMFLPALAYAVVVLLSLSNVPRGLLRLSNHYSLVFKGDIVSPVIKFAGALILLATNPTLIGFLTVWALSELTTAALFWYYLWRSNNYQFGLFGLPGARESVRENASIRSTLLASNLGETSLAVMQQLPILLVGSLVGVSEAGLYRLAHQLTQSLSTLSGLINLASLAEMANLAASGAKQKLRRLFLHMTGMSAALGLLILAIAFFFGEAIITTIAGREFSPAFDILLVLAAATSIQLAAVNCEPLLISIGRTKALASIRVVSIVFAVLALLGLITTMGAVGAALARLAAQSFVLSAFIVAIFLGLRQRAS